MRGTITVVVVMCALSGAGCAKSQFSAEQYNRHHEAKQAALERLLGPMHNMVGHAIIPFGLQGGTVDMYYFPNGIPGTAFATMELIQADGSGPKPNRIGTYELVTFTKLKMPPSDKESEDENDPFNKIHNRMCWIMTGIGLYSSEAVLNPGETCEFPEDEGQPGPCLIFDEYRNGDVGFEIEERKHCLLLCMEIFRSEMEYAMQNGGEVVLRKLKEAGHYPYSDLDRDPVF